MPSTLTAVRLPPELLERADALLEPLAARVGGSAGLFTRSHVVRLAIERGLELLEAECGTTPAAKKKPAKRPTKR